MSVVLLPPDWATELGAAVGMEEGLGNLAQYGPVTSGYGG